MVADLDGRVARTLAVLAAATALGIALVTVVPDVIAPTDPGTAPWWVVGVAFLLAETFALHARGRISVAALSPQAATLGVGLFLLGPGGLLAAQLAGAAVALAVANAGARGMLRRLATVTVATLAALTVFDGIGSLSDMSGAVGWIAATVAVTAAAAVELYVATTGDGESEHNGIDHIGLIFLAGAVASAGVSVVAIELLRTNRWAVVLLVLPFASCAVAVWAHTAEHRRLLHLRLLYESMRRVHRMPGRDAGVLELLDAPRTLVGADAAWLALLPRRRSEPMLVASTGRDGTSPLQPCALPGDREAAVLAEAGAAGARSVRGDDGSDRLHGLLSDLGLQRAISMPLRGNPASSASCSSAISRRRGRVRR